jgi:signal transduction histidine kinase
MRGTFLRFALFCGIITFNSSVHAQLDSLQKVFLTVNTVSEKANINIEIAKYFNLQRSYDSVAYYLDAAESNPKQLTIEQKATIYNLKMMVSYYSGAIDSAIKQGDIAAEQYRMLGNSKLQADMMMRKAQILSQQSQGKEAITTLDLVYDLAIENKDSLMILSSIFTHASVLSELKMDKEAKLKYEKGFEMIKAGRPNGYTDADYAVDINNYANTLSNLDELDPAIRMFQNALEINTRIKDSINMASNLVNIGQTELFLNRFKDARKQLELSVTILERLNYDIALISAYSSLGELEYKVENLAQSEKLLSKALSLSRKLQIPDGEISALTYLALVYKEQGRFETAFQTQFLLSELKDSLNALTYSKTFERMRENYDSQSAQLENTLLKQNSELHKSELDQSLRATRNLWIALLTLAILMTSLIIYARVMRNKNMIIDEQKDRLNQLITFKNELLRELNATLSHDVRSPLSSTLSVIDLMEHTEKLSPEGQDYLKMIKEFSKSGLKLTNAMLMLDKIESGNLIDEKELINPKLVFEHLCLQYESLAQLEGIELICEFEETPSFTTNKMSLERILDNIISNAFKFTDKGGEITLRLMFRKPDRLIFEIADSGQGMDTETLENIFKKRSSNDTNKGAFSFGLGLYIAKALADNLNANIEVQSTKGKGSSFRILFNLEA